MTTDKKIFRWFEGTFQGKEIRESKGPYYTQDVNDIGSQKSYHTLDELLKIRRLSESKRKKISNARPGTKIKFCRLHSCGFLFLQRMDDLEIEKLTKVQSLKEQISNLKKEIDDSIPKELKDRLKKLEKELNKESK